jgi:hypothetical protein
MPSWAEVLGDGTIGREGPLRVSGGLDSPHPPLPLAGRLTGVLRTVVQRPVLPMLDAGQDLPLGRAITFKPVRHDHTRDIRESLEQLAEKLLGGLLVPPTLHLHIKHVAILIHRPPEIMTPTTNGEEHFIQVPRVARSGVPATQLIRVGLPKLQTPFAYGFVGHDDPAGIEQLFHVPVAEAESVAQPDPMAGDLGREAVILVVVDGCCIHEPSMAHQASARQAPNKLTGPVEVIRGYASIDHRRLPLLP